MTETREIGAVSVDGDGITILDSSEQKLYSIQEPKGLNLGSKKIAVYGSGSGSGSGSGPGSGSSEEPVW